MDCLQDRLNKYQGRSVKGRRYLPRRVLALSRLVAGRWRRVRQRLGADYDGAGARRRGQLHLMAALHYPSPAATTRCQVRVAKPGAAIHKHNTEARNITCPFPSPWSACLAESSSQQTLGCPTFNCSYAIFQSRRVLPPPPTQSNKVTQGVPVTC